MYYYDKSVFVGAETAHSTGDNICEKIGGTYLKIYGNIPISIYNIVDSWYDNNGIVIDPDRKMMIKVGTNHQLETFVPTISK